MVLLLAGVLYKQGRKWKVDTFFGDVLNALGEKPDLPPSAAVAGGTTALIVRFVLAMQESKLEEADRVAAQLADAGSRAKDEVQRLMVDEIPPAGLEDLPPALYKGFLKSLLDRL